MIIVAAFSELLLLTNSKTKSGLKIKVFLDRAVPERICFPLSDDFSFEQGALLRDGVGTPYHAIKRLAINGIHTAALFGLGPVGLSALLILKLLNCKVIAVGFFDFC